jgi:adenylate kinase family enzyme
MKRVIVIGSSCSGKTTLARSIAKAIDAPHIELDALFWGPNWAEADTELFRSAVREKVVRDRWVVDGNYRTVRDIVWPRATHAVWLNYSFPVVFGRALARTVRRVASREELFGGNRESFMQSFLSSDSILWWVITTYESRRKEYRKLFDGGAFPSLFVTELRRTRDAAALLEEIRCGRAPANATDNHACEAY